MSVSRRNFLKTTSLAAVPITVHLPDVALFQFGTEDDISFYKVSDEFHVLNRMGFGPRKGDVERLQNMGLKAYVKEQLNPDPKKDKLVENKIKKATLDISYTKNQTAGGEGEKVNEDRPLSHLNLSQKECWELYPAKAPLGWHEWIRPAMEVMAATWLRATYSKYQLKEVMVEFWHNHFNVSVDGAMENGTFIPHYDRDVMRKNCFGNFRVFLEDVAKSPSMLYYLNNRSNKNGPANENYGREILELHTLGEEHYYNDKYKSWDEVPGSKEGKSIGYIDKDVYEVSRCFTGWSVADGRKIFAGTMTTLPSTGEFHYIEAWHDERPKRVLGVEIPRRQGPLKDGQMVLDILASHPGTAKHICKKICRRLVADNPSESLIQRAADLFLKAKDDDDQVAQVLELILLSDEFLNAKRQKVKRPFELIASYFRATDAEVTPNMMLYWVTGGMGYNMFRWPAPTGHPDEAVYWSGPGMMSKKWGVINTFMQWKDMNTAKFDLVGKSKNKSAIQLVDYWTEQLVGKSINTSSTEALIKFACQGIRKKEEVVESYPENIINMVVGQIAMSPEFQMR